MKEKGEKEIEIFFKLEKNVNTHTKYTRITKQKTRSNGWRDEQREKA